LPTVVTLILDQGCLGACVPAAGGLAGQIFFPDQRLLDLVARSELMLVALFSSMSLALALALMVFRAWPPYPPLGFGRGVPRAENQDKTQNHEFFDGKTQTTHLRRISIPLTVT